jgi:hypothetical protein
MDRWPNFRELQVAGLAHLQVQIKAHGGPRILAARFGVAYTPGTRNLKGSWSEERLRAGLEAYLADKDEWPSYSEFTADGHTALRKAVTWFGGPERWAAELGVERKPHRVTRTEWSDARVTEELARFTSGRADWPTWTEFEEAGLDNLRRRIHRTAATERLAAHLRLRLPDPQSSTGRGHANIRS